MFGVIHAKPIKRACTSACDAGKVSAFLSLQRMKRSLCVLLRAFFENNIDVFRFWRPNAEVCFVCADQFCSDRIATKLSGIGHTILLPTSTGLVVRSDNFLVPLQHQQSRTCGLSLRKQP